MSLEECDFERLLSEALTAGVDDVPSTHGLADRARALRRRRQRRRVAAWAVAAVLAVAIPSALIQARESSPTTTPATSGPAVRVVEAMGLRLELPDDCAFYVGSGPPRLEAGTAESAPRCGVQLVRGYKGVTGDGVRFGDGEWTGQGGAAAGVTVLVHARERAVVEGVLDSTRVAGGDTERWQHHEVDGVTFLTPPTWIVPACPDPRYAPALALADGQPCDDRDAVRVDPSTPNVVGLRFSVTATGDGQWSGSTHVQGYHATVSTGVLGVSQRILDSFGTTDDGWTSVAADGVSVNLPPGCELGRPSETCNVTIAPTSTFEAGSEPGQVSTQAAIADGPSGGSTTIRYLGFVYVGDHVVQASAPVEAVVRRVLASASPAG